MVRVALLDANAMAKVASQLNLSNSTQESAAETQGETDEKGRKRDAQSTPEQRWIHITLEPKSTRSSTPECP